MSEHKDLAEVLANTNVMKEYLNRDGTVGRLKLLHPRECDVDVWLLQCLNELKNSLDAHMTLYAGNPGRWDPESSYGALQTLTEQISAHTVSLIKPVPSLSLNHSQRVAYKVLAQFISDSHMGIGPLVREGATTNNDAAKFVKCFTATLECLGRLLADEPPELCYAKLQQKRRVWTGK